MDNYIEYTGKKIEKALEKAGKDLNQDPLTLRYEVISYGSTGIFGLVGAKKAKIRVKVESNSMGSDIHKEARAEAKNLVKDAFKTDSDTTQPTKNKNANLPKEEFESAIGIGMEALTTLVNAITDDATISVENRNSRILFKIEGGNSAILIGKRGQTLEAIQYLVEKIVKKQCNSRLRVMVDVKGYLGARKANLKKMASKMADKVIKTNKPVTVGQMNAYDRRIVHMSLKDNQNVRTQSMGEGYYRKLVIFPKRKRGR